VTQGIFGTLAWLFFIVTALYFVGKLLRVVPDQKSDQLIYLYVVLGLVFFLAAHVVYNPSVVLTALTFIFLGFFISLLVDAKIIKLKKIQIDKSPRTSFLYILVLVLILVCGIYVAYVQVSQYSSRVLFDRGTVQFSEDGNVEDAWNRIQRAQFLFSSDIYFRALTELGLLRINEIIQDKTLSQDQAVSQFTSTLQNTIAMAQGAISYDTQSYVNRISLLSTYKSLIPIGVEDAQVQALRVLEDTEKLTPKNPTLMLEKARVYALSKNYDMAIEEIKKAIELKPNYIDAVFLLSQIQVEKGQINEAIQSIQSGIQVDPSNPNLRFQLGLLYYNQEKFNDASALFEDAIRYSPAFANAQYFLGLSYYKNNRTLDAISVFENLNSQIPNNSEIQLILNNMKGGQDPFYGAQPPLDTAPEEREELPLEDSEVEAVSENQ